jgi:hypothetical protein
MSPAKILPFIRPQTKYNVPMGLPQDYARPDEPCSHCGRNAWYERKASLGSGWACSRCHPSYEMIMEQQRGKHA